MRLDGIIKGVILFLSIISIYLPSDAQTIGDVLKKQQLKVLDIGNSYTDDATSYLKQITNASGSDINDMCLYKAYRGGGSFKNWYDIYHDNDASSFTISKVIGGIKANISTGEGAPKDGALFRETLTNEKWDIIIIHQYSQYAPYYEQWTGTGAGGYLNEFLSLIKEYQPQAKIGILLIHSYGDNYSGNKEGSSFERWKLIAKSVKNICSNYDVDFVIPYGTAVENLRSSSLNNEYDLTRDGTHCGHGLCRYTAACCYYEALIAPRSGISVLGNSARYDASKLTSKYPITNVTDENAHIAQMAAFLATNEKYRCLNPEEYILKDPNDTYFNLVYKIDSEIYSTSQVNYLNKITIVEPAPSKEGYTFSGWSEIPPLMPAHDVTVTGTFSINKYKLIYKVDGVDYKSYDVEYGASIIPEETPTKEGYTFSGWGEIPETMPANDVTVTGTFSINSYKLFYVVDGERYKTYDIEYGAAITPENEPTKEGYSFSGWSEIPETMPANDVMVTGTFAINKYLISYIIDGEVFATDSVEYGATIIPPTVDEREGFTFSGWDEVPETMPEHDVVVYASYISDINEGLITTLRNMLIYSISGWKRNTLYKGLNIVKFSDGRVKKVVVK